MAIINDRNNNKTINTETGTYLTLVDEHGYSGYLGLELHAGNEVLYISITRKRPVEVQGKRVVTRYVDNVAQRKKY